MKNKLLLTAIALLLIVGAAGIFVALHRSKSISSTNVAQAKASPAKESCKKADPNVRIATAERNTIELAVISHIINVPAGTNVDVHLADYSPSSTPSSASGAINYQGDYGTYNFAAEKSQPQTSHPQQMDWVITSFVRCKV